MRSIHTRSGNKAQTGQTIYMMVRDISVWAHAVGMCHLSYGIVTWTGGGKKLG